MEVIVSSAVLVLVVLGVLAAMDAISGTAGANQARTVAAALAEDDQESLRGLSVEDLDRLETIRGETRTAKVGAVTYTIKSEAVWVTDSTGEEASCALATSEGSYLRIKSTVTSPITGAKVPPVVISSIVAPQPGEGTLAAKVTNAAGLPVQNLTVSATGPDNLSAVTNAAGCAVFGKLEAGSYSVRINQSPWVDKDGVTDVIKSANVTSGNLTTAEFVLDRAASFTVAFDSVVNRGSTPVTESDRSVSAMVVHTGLQTGSRSVPATATATAALSFPVTNLFPFTSPYKVYSGRCAGNDPTKYIPTYFDTAPGSAAVVQLTPGQIGGTVTVREPALNVRVTQSGSARSGATVFAYPQTTGCTSPARITVGTTDSNGYLPDPGLPFGSYTVCAEYNDRKRTVTTAIANTNPAGTAVQTLDIPTSGSSDCGTGSP